MNGALSDFQHSFAQALLAPATSPAVHAAATQPAFAVYRNTVLKACVDALQANFPTVAQLVGEDWFRSAAADYARTEPPRDGRLLAYGTGFPLFLERLLALAGQRDSLPYLAGVAQLDRFWREAHGAADACPVDASVLAALPADALAHTALAPHPAARWAWFDTLPVFAIWQRERNGHAGPGEEQQLVWAGDGALLTRPRDTVAWQPLDAAGCAFLDACADGKTLLVAADHALCAQPDADIGTLLQRLLQAGALCNPSSPPSLETT